MASSEQESCPVTPDCNAVSPFEGKFYGKTNSISAKYDVWQRELVCDSDKEFLLKGIEHGFGRPLEIGFAPPCASVTGTG